jgi:hypothetical protein
MGRGGVLVGNGGGGIMVRVEGKEGEEKLIT